ncbi:MAG: hypothetical protein GX446_18690 [Chthonomonadales bacterium]|nr:hypothetical protein [Chthonomonadales bacterium]
MTGLVRQAAVVAWALGLSLQALGQSAADPPMVIRDRFGRDLAQRGITLVDWQGHIANPAIPLKVELSGRVNLPARVVMKANGQRLMFNLFSDVGSQGPEKTIFLDGPSRTASFFMSVFPDRDAHDETYRLSLELTTGVGERRTASWPIRVIDQDRDMPDAYPMHLDFTHDALGFFGDPAIRRTIEQAARDWAYFFDDQGFAPVAAGAETAWIHEPDTFERGRTVTNATDYRGFLLFAQSIRGPERRSGGRCSDQGGLQVRDGRKTGLRRSGTVISEVTGNWNGLGWSVEESDDRWWTSSNHAREPHDYYSVVRQEIGHALLYHRPIPGFGKLIRSGRVRDRELERYLGGAPAINASEHLFQTVDPVSRVGAFGNEYGGDMPRKRWLITKVDLLVARAAGYRLRETTPLMPLEANARLAIAVRVGEPVQSSLQIRGGIPAYDCQIVRGSLPDGVALDPFTGAITGSPRRPGRYRATVEVRDNDPADPKTRVEVTVGVMGRESGS